ncbi:MAG: DNA repair protein RadC, partial [Verrucomicrobiae bacterium]|nr:DNA repair protein RadC [Verrucomicrobiae bacterium]
MTQLIREMPETERPRERLWRLGPEALRTDELIAILLRTGTAGRSAIALAQQLLRQHGDSLNALARARAPMLAKIPGLGRTKAIQVAAAFELARRLVSEQQHRLDISDPDAAANCLREEFRTADREIFRALLLDTKNRLIHIACISTGTVNASLVEPRELFKAAIAYSATSVIVAHTHPSGDPAPSAEDLAITKRLVQA